VERSAEALLGVCFSWVFFFFSKTRAREGETLVEAVDVDCGGGQGLLERSGFRSPFFLAHSPPTYPLIYKTLRLDENLTVRGAVETIAETLHLPEAGASIGLFIPAETLWLDNEKTLADYPTLADADEIEYKDRQAGNAGGNGGGGGGGGGGEGCCVLL
jgi:hypothetical protein